MARLRNTSLLALRCSPRDPSNVILACISVLAVVTIANVLFTLHSISVLDALLPPAPHIYSKYYVIVARV